MSIIGIPLSEVFNGTAHGDALPQACLSGQETGQISGVASDGEGHLLAQYTVRATRLTLANSSTEATQSAGTTATDAAGQFSFTGLRASSYLVEVLSGHEVLAGASLTLGEGTMHVSGVTLAPLPGGRGYPRAWVFTPIVRLFRHVRIKRHPSFWAPRRR